MTTHFITVRLPHCTNINALKRQLHEDFQPVPAAALTPRATAECGGHGIQLCWTNDIYFTAINPAVAPS